MAGKNKRLTFRKHLFQLEDASGRFLNTPQQLRNLTVFCSDRAMGTCRRSTTGMPTRACQQPYPRTAPVESPRPSATFTLWVLVSVWMSASQCWPQDPNPFRWPSKSHHRNTFTGWPQTMPPPTDQYRDQPLHLLEMTSPAPDQTLRLPKCARRDEGARRSVVPWRDAYHCHHFESCEVCRHLRT